MQKLLLVYFFIIKSYDNILFYNIILPVKCYEYFYKSVPAVCTVHLLTVKFIYLLMSMNMNL